MTPEISIVLPVHNEENSISVLLKEIADVFEGNIRRHYEIIIVDDASEDKSAVVARKAADNLRYSRFLVNSACLIQATRRGQSTALARGLAVAQGKLIVTMDADLQHDPADIIKLMAELDEYDMVCGIRRGRIDGIARLLCSRIANAFRNWVTGDSIVDSGCMFRVFRRECIPVILPLDGCLFGCEILFYPVFIRRNGFRVGEISVCHRQRTSGKSNYRLMRGRLIRGIAASLRVRNMLSSLE